HRARAARRAPRPARAAGPRARAQSRRQLGPDLAAQELPGLVVGQRVAELDPLGHARGAQPRAYPLAQLLGPRPAARAPGGHRGDGLAPLLVGDADDRAVGDAGVLVQHVLDLAGREVLAAAHDHVVDAAGDEEVALFVEEAAVARREPAVGPEARAAALVLARDLLPPHPALAQPPA